MRAVLYMKKRWLYRIVKYCKKTIVWADLDWTFWNFIFISMRLDENWVKIEKIRKMVRSVSEASGEDTIVFMSVVGLVGWSLIVFFPGLPSVWETWEQGYQHFCSDNRPLTLEVKLWKLLWCVERKAHNVKWKKKSKETKIMEKSTFAGQRVACQ